MIPRGAVTVQVLGSERGPEEWRFAIGSWYPSKGVNVPVRYKPESFSRHLKFLVNLGFDLKFYNNEGQEIK